MPNGNDKKDNNTQAQAQAQGKSASSSGWAPSSRYERCTSGDRTTSDHSQYIANQKSKQWTDRSSSGANSGRSGK